jgi:hypothetical protein
MQSARWQVVTTLNREFEVHSSEKIAFGKEMKTKKESIHLEQEHPMTREKLVLKS